jgi:hypothetical protein
MLNFGFLAILGMAELDACVARFMKVIIRNLATHPDAENRLKKPKQSFVFEFSAHNNFLVHNLVIIF